MLSDMLRSGFPFKLTCLIFALCALHCGEAAANEDDKIIDPDEVVTQEETMSPGRLPEQLTSLCVIDRGDNYWTPCHSEDRYPMTFPQFFQSLGRPDLLNSYRNRQRTKAWLFYGGLGVGVAGIGVSVAGFASESSGLAVAGLGTFGVGMLLLVANGFVDHLPIGSVEAARLAASYHLQAPSTSLPPVPPNQSLAIRLPLWSGTF